MVFSNIWNFLNPITCTLPGCPRKALRTWFKVHRWQSLHHREPEPILKLKQNPANNTRSCFAHHSGFCPLATSPEWVSATLFIKKTFKIIWYISSALLTLAKWVQVILNRAACWDFMDVISAGKERLPCSFHRYVGDVSGKLLSRCDCQIQIWHYIKSRKKQNIIEIISIIDKMEIIWCISILSASETICANISTEFQKRTRNILCCPIISILQISQYTMVVTLTMRAF